MSDANRGVGSRGFDHEVCGICGKKFSRIEGNHKCSNYAIQKYERMLRERKKHERTFDDRLKEAEDMTNDH